MDKKAVIGTFSVGSSFRLACGNPSIPARSHITAQTAHLLFCIFLSASVTTDLSIPRVLSQVFPARVPARSQLTAQTAHLLFCILLSVSVTTDVSILRVLSQVFLLGYPRAIISPR